MAALAFLLPGWFLGSGGSDLAYHLLWHKHFSAQFWQGDLYPKWLYGMNAGCGSPSFYYYPPLPYYLSALLSFLNEAAPRYWHPLLAAGFAVTLGAGVAAYHWLKPQAGHFAALWASVLYLLLPYSAAVFYGGFLYSFYFGVLWAPLLLLGTWHLMQGSRAAAPALGVAYAGLALSTIPGTIVLAPLPFLYLAAHRVARPRIWIRLCASALLGMALSAWYWLPMLALLPEAYVGASGMMWEGDAHYAENFLFSPRFLLMDEGHALVAVTNALIAVAAGMMGWTLARKDRQHAAHWGPCLALFALAFILTLPISKPLWQAAPLWQRLQFPHRFLMAAGICFAGLCAWLIRWRVQRVGEAKARWEVWLIGGCGLIAASSCFMVAVRYDADAPRSYAHSPFHQQRMQPYAYESLPSPEYLPKSANASFFLPSRHPQGMEELRARCTALPSCAQHSGKGRCFDVTPPRSALLLPHFYFPGLAAHGLGEGGMRLEARMSAGEDGLAYAEFDEAVAQVTVSRRALEAERLGIWISLAAMLAALGWLKASSQRKFT